MAGRYGVSMPVWVGCSLCWWPERGKPEGAKKKKKDIRSHATPTTRKEERKKEARWKEGGKEGKVDGRAWQEDIFLAVESDDGRRREQESNAKDANKEGWRLPLS